MTSALHAPIVCPHCHAEVDAHLDTCPMCRKPIGATGNSKTEAQLIDRPWIIVLLLLHVGFLGIPIYMKANYSITTRLWICVISILYTVFAVGAIVGMSMWLYRQFTGG